MKKTEVAVGKTYVVKVSGQLTRVRLAGESPYGGWIGKNLSTGREVRIRTAAKLRREVVPPRPAQTVHHQGSPVHDVHPGCQKNCSQQ